MWQCGLSNGTINFQDRANEAISRNLMFRISINPIKSHLIFLSRLRERHRQEIRDKFEKEEREDKLRMERQERNKKWRQRKEGKEALEEDEKELDDNEKRKLKNREWRLKRESPEVKLSNSTFELCRQIKSQRPFCACL